MLLYEDRTTCLTKDKFIRDIRNAGKGMLAVDVFGAVINYFKEHLLKDLIINEDQVFENKYVHWVITIPAIWDSEARIFMKEAAKKANIYSDQLTIVAEPEAASFYCRAIPTQEQLSSDGFIPLVSMQECSQYIVLDQGGGTTDIIVHEFTSPDTVQEIHHPFGGCYGGNTVNEYFIAFLEKLFGVPVMQQIREDHPSEYLNMLSEFEMKKKSVRRDDNGDFSLPLSEKWLDCWKSISERVENSNLREQVSVKKDKLRIKRDVFLSFFNYSIKKVLEILEKLIKKPQIRHIDLLLAVGGYCESFILINAIKQKFPELKVIQPQDPSLAVLKGAVLYGFKSHEESRLPSHDC